ncbi:hypothetical protein VitviT2T_008347 [Vitis vinifera]|uniref:Protein kinase domain-containing protein n=2 Tax=Vitis vinifera TaxID=29760 RepID=A0ABY9C207_VITVI|nr:mitogen-activated protein kinase kinase kinase 18 [Vitis vinifera]WJZ89101.1 hypothetical protein VitviT2T_008347 [Vitis vinifera]|eukprot:XP_010651429.1 PREDICTED: mitogen-activated protein kinase kinase kinase NPK1 [Vitis vinifera]
MEAQTGVCSWIRAKRIGEGSFGTVDLAVTRSDGGVFAVKSVDRRVGQECRVEALENEIGVLRRLSSPYVVRYLGDDVSVEGGTAPFRNLHVEYMPGGTVADLAVLSGGKCADVDERIVRSYTYCIVSSLRYVHSMGLVHCDVKGRNVLVGGGAGVAKLADFGAARRITGEVGRQSSAILPRGSPLWMAPEVIRREYQGPESDVWSLGCTVIEMVSGKPAWEDCGADTLFRIGFSDELPKFPAQLSDLGRDFLEKCLRREPTERWSCDQLLQHPFVSSSSPNYITDASPRSVLDCFNFSDDDDEETELNPNPAPKNSVSAHDRIRKLASNRGPVWESEDWMDVRTWISDRAEATAASCCGDEGEGTNSAYSNSTGKTEESEKTFAECPSTRGTPLLDTVGKLGCDPGSSCGYESGTNGSGESKETGVYSHCKLILLLSYLRIMRRNSQIFYIYIIYLEPLTLIDACDRLFHSYQNDISDLVCYTVVQSLFHHKLLSTSSKLM